MDNGPDFNLPEILVFSLQNIKGDLYGTLLELCQPVLFSAINKFYLDGYEKDDLIQEGRIILTQAVIDYDFESNLEFMEYYQMMLMNHLYKLLRKQEAQRRRANKNAYSLDEITENLGIHIQGNSAVETNPEVATLVNEAYEEYIKDLSNREKFIYSEYLKGKSVEEIIDSSTFDLKQVRGALYRCRHKLSKKLQ